MAAAFLALANLAPAAAAGEGRFRGSAPVEPVASLDPPTSHVVMRDLQRINAAFGITVVVSLHFLDLARRYSDRLIGLRVGSVICSGPTDGADESALTDIYGRSLTAEDVLGCNER